MNIKSCIFTSGEATNENAAFGVHELNKNQSYTGENQIFCFFYCKITYFSPSAVTTENYIFFRISFMMFNVFTGYTDIGSKLKVCT